MMMAAAANPLWLAGHLPHKGSGIAYQYFGYCQEAMNGGFPPGPLDSICAAKSSSATTCPSTARR